MLDMPENQELREKLKELEEYISNIKNLREWKRGEAVRLRLIQKSYEEIQQRLGVSISFIAKSQKKYLEKGIPGLKLGYQGSKSYLTPSQLEEIEQWLIPLERRNISELERHLIEEKDWLITCCLFAPYGPKENPVEAIWLQVKNFIRRFYYRCRNFSIAKKLFQLFFKFNLFNPPNLEKYDAFVQMI
jgi:hypothetical protein